MKESNKGKITLGQIDPNEVNTYHIAEMIRAILSVCIQKGTDSASVEDIKQFYTLDNFDKCFEATLPYLNEHFFKNIPESLTYSFEVKRKLFDGRIVSGYGLQGAISKSDRS